MSGFTSHLTLDQIWDELKSLSVDDLHELINRAEIEFNIRITYELRGQDAIHHERLFLKHVPDDKKVAAIEHVRAFTGMELEKARAVVEAVMETGWGHVIVGDVTDAEVDDMLLHCQNDGIEIERLF